MIGAQFGVNFLGRLAFLTVVCFHFNVVGYTVQEFLVFTLAWLLSDLAVLIYLRKLNIATHGKVFSMKLEKNPSPFINEAPIKYQV